MMQRSPLVRWSSWALWSCFLCSGLKVQVPSFTADVPFLLLLADVGFTPGVELSVNITSSEPGAVFLLLSSTQLHDWLHGPPREDTDGNLSSYFASQWRQPLSRQLSARIDLDLPKVDFFYAGIFDPTFNAETPKKYKIDLDFVNAHGQHLPVQWAKLPLMWAISSIAFSFFVQGAVILTSTTWYRSSTPLHGLLMLCAALKAIELVVRAELFRVLSLAGDAPPWKLKVWRLLHYVTDTFELLVMVLIALGWKVLRSRLSDVEMRCVRVLFATGMLMALAEAQVTGPFRPASGLGSIFAITQMVIYLSVILTVNQNLQILAMGLEESHFSPTTILMYRKQQAYFRFRIAFYLMLLRPSILAWLRLTVIEESTEWLLLGIGEALLLIVYILLFSGLKPTSDKSGLMKLWRSEMRGSSRRGVQGSGTGGQLGATLSLLEERAVATGWRNPQADAEAMPIPDIPYIALD